MLDLQKELTQVEIDFKKASTVEAQYKIAEGIVARAQKLSTYITSAGEDKKLASLVPQYQAALATMKKNYGNDLNNVDAILAKLRGTQEAEDAKEGWKSDDADEPPPAPRLAKDREPGKVYMFNGKRRTWLGPGNKSKTGTVDAVSHG